MLALGRFGMKPSLHQDTSAFVETRLVGDHYFLVDAVELVVFAVVLRQQTVDLQDLADGGSGVGPRVGLWLDFLLITITAHIITIKPHIIMAI